MEYVILHVYYMCKAGQAEAFVQALKSSGLQGKVQAEDGCIQYDYHLSLEEKDVVVLLEKWSSAAALEKHLAQPHMAEIRALKEQYVDDARLEKYLCRDM